MGAMSEHPYASATAVAHEVGDGASFPRRMARTQRFTLGTPRAFTLSPDGDRVVFLRSVSGTARTGLLWSMDATTGEETLLADPVELLDAGADETLSHEERARRERMREGGAGITSYSTDKAVRLAVFALSSRLFVADLIVGGARELPAVGPVIDPRLSPDGSQVAYVANGGLHVVSTHDGSSRTLAQPDGPDVTWGLAEFVASEELERYRGHWWLPDGSGLLVARVDESPVGTWWVADPAHPETEPYAHRYPSAGTANALVTLHHRALDGTGHDYLADDDALTYLVKVVVDEERPPLVVLMDRHQQLQRVFSIEDHALVPVRDLRDDAWVDVIAGSPQWWGEQLLTVEVSEDTYRLCLDGVPFSPVGLQVRAVGAIEDDGVLVTAAVDPVESRLVLVRADGSTEDLGPTGAHVGGARVAGTTLLRVERLGSVGATITLTRSGGDTRVVRSLAEDPGFLPRATLVPGPYEDSRTLVLLPTAWTTADGPLPVIVSPYGGPHHAEVLYAGRIYLGAQWIADQGFAVVVADGHGTPGSPSWEREMRLDVAGPALEGQVRGLEAAAKAFPEALDLSRVGIRGWSFGGYLAALAVLQRPDVFHAAVAGAPPSDWALYDTAYTERYLGLPDEQPEAYASTSLLPMAAKLERPLMIIHGMADDNVVVANTLQLSRALLEAGRPHQVLPLSGVTHMTPQEVVTENILRLELDFLRKALASG
jgi:dipeptidyl-peptidase 4